MWSRLTFCCLAVLFAGPLSAAPAPFADQSRTGPAEVVLAARSSDQAAMVLPYLRSERFRDRLLATPQVRELTCLSGEKDRRAWLSARLKVEAKGPGSLLVVRLNGCRLRDGLVILQAVVAQVAKKPDPRLEGAQRANLAAERRLIAAMRLRLQVRPIAARARQIDRIEESLVGGELAVNPLKVKQAPARAR
jgi:hypothetical protein